MAFRNVLETFSEEHQLEQLHELDADECDALFELLLAGVLIDGELSHEEAELLADEFSHLPFYAIAHTAEITGEHGFMRRGEMLERITNEGVDSLLEGIAARLTTVEHREAALRALALVLEAEGVAQDELSFAMQAAKALDVAGAEMLEILRKAWDLNHPPFG